MSIAVVKEMVPYRAEWPGEFQSLAKPLRAALGDLVLRIDHIGSTSVPGLMSKDRIDVQITVENFSDETVTALAAALSPLGYDLIAGNLADHQPPGDSRPASDWEKRYFRGTRLRPTNTHVRIQGRANQRYALLFRDYLRTHAQAAAPYGELKRRLADYVGEDRENYVEIKDPVCDLIMAAAEDWAGATGWSPGCSDA